MAGAFNYGSLRRELTSVIRKLKIPISVLSWNISGGTTKGSPEIRSVLVPKIVAEINPDVVLLQEVETEKIIKYIASMCSLKCGRSYMYVPGTAAQRNVGVLYDSQIFTIIPQQTEEEESTTEEGTAEEEEEENTAKEGEKKSTEDEEEEESTKDEEEEESTKDEEKEESTADEEDEKEEKRMNIVPFVQKVFQEQRDKKKQLKKKKQPKKGGKLKEEEQKKLKEEEQKKLKEEDIDLYKERVVAVQLMHTITKKQIIFVSFHNKNEKGESERLAKMFCTIVLKIAEEHKNTLVVAGADLNSAQPSSERPFIPDYTETDRRVPFDKIDYFILAKPNTVKVNTSVMAWNILPPKNPHSMQAYSRKDYHKALNHDPLLCTCQLVQ